MHLQEFAENSVDFQHFDPLHGRMMVPWTTYSIPGVLIDHVAEWVPGTDDEGSHIAHFRDHASLRIGKWNLPKSSADADITFVGKWAPHHHLYGVHQHWLTTMPLDVISLISPRACWHCHVPLHATRAGRHPHVPNPPPARSRAATLRVPLVRRPRHPARTCVVRRRQLGEPVGQRPPGLGEQGLSATPPPRAR